MCSLVEQDSSRLESHCLASTACNGMLGRSIPACYNYRRIQCTIILESCRVCQRGEDVNMYVYSKSKHTYIPPWIFWLSTSVQNPNTSVPLNSRATHEFAASPIGENVVLVGEVTQSHSMQASKCAGKESTVALKATWRITRNPNNGPQMKQRNF